MNLQPMTPPTIPDGTDVPDTARAELAAVLSLIDKAGAEQRAADALERTVLTANADDAQAVLADLSRIALHRIGAAIAIVHADRQLLAWLDAALAVDGWMTVAAEAANRAVLQSERDLRERHAADLGIEQKWPRLLAGDKPYAEAVKRGQPLQTLRNESRELRANLRNRLVADLAAYHQIVGRTIPAGTTAPHLRVA